MSSGTPRRRPLWWRGWKNRPWLGLLFGTISDPSTAERNQWEPVELPEPIVDLDTQFFVSNQDGRVQSGLFGLDGIHPTVSGYGIVAADLLGSGRPTIAMVQNLDSREPETGIWPLISP